VYDVGIWTSTRRSPGRSGFETTGAVVCGGVRVGVDVGPAAVGEELGAEPEPQAATITRPAAARNTAS
jgi:hypothetical protein